MDTSVIWVALIGVTIILNLSSSNNELRLEIKRLNKKLDKILDSMGIKDEELEVIKEELKELISKNEKIKAIKRYREYTGLGLKESKEYIDGLSEEINKNKGLIVK